MALLKIILQLFLSSIRGLVLKGVTFIFMRSLLLTLRVILITAKSVMVRL